jgi:hypothetical protein
MRCTIVILAIAAVNVRGDDEFAQRASPDHVPRQHTAERAGIIPPASHAASSVTPRNIVGYVNGTTFGMDNSLLGRRPGRLFDGLWPQGRKPTSWTSRYRSEGDIHVTDILALKPFRKAVIEAKDEHAHGSTQHAKE